MTKEELIGKVVDFKSKSGFTHRYKVLSIDDNFVEVENTTLDASGKYTIEQFEEYTGIKIER